MSMPRPVLPVFEFETPADDATPPRSDGPQEGSTHVIRRTFEPRQSDELVVFVECSAGFDRAARRADQLARGTLLVVW